MIVPTGDTIGIGLTAGTKMRTSNRIGAIASDVPTIEQNESNTSHRTRQFTPKADIQIFKGAGHLVLDGKREAVDTVQRFLS